MHQAAGKLLLVILLAWSIIFPIWVISVIFDREPDPPPPPSKWQHRPADYEGIDIDYYHME